jgi:hypothetical protein
MRIAWTIRWLLLLGVVVVFETACGPIRATSGLVYARQALDEAEADGADSVALYEMTLAREYLRKASEELGYNDYYMAEQLAIKAEQLADLAREKTIGTAAFEQEKPPEITGTPEVDVEELPDWGELDPDRRAGDEDADEQLLEAEDPWGDYTPSTGDGDDEENTGGTP